MVCFVVGIIFVGFPGKESWMTFVGWSSLALGIVFFCLFISAKSRHGIQNDRSPSKASDVVKQKSEKVYYNKELLRHAEESSCGSTTGQITSTTNRFFELSQAEQEAFRASRLRERDEAVKLHAAYIKDRQEHPETFPGRK